MPCPIDSATYKVQAGDSLYNISRKFNITLDDIYNANPGISPNTIYVGQQICIPMVLPRNAVNSYISQIPVIINGVDINKPPYQVLNYHPEGAQYPYTYVPIAIFEKVGSKVVWDPQTSTITVTSDHSYQDSIRRNFEYMKKVCQGTYYEDRLDPNRTIKVIDAGDDFVVFPLYDKLVRYKTDFEGNYVGNYTPGNEYPYVSEAYGPTGRLVVKDDNGVWHTFNYTRNIYG